MKKLLLLCSLLIASAFSFSSFAQYPCTPERYSDEVFASVNISSGITYGSAKNINNSTETLTLDVYEPAGDTASKRPLIIWGHGGSFVGGSKTDPDVVALCTRFAKRGYVCVSYNYRIGMGFPINQANASRAVYRATQDAKGVIRYFRKDAATTNAYKIDPGYVYLGGSSAGAFTALHLAYLDQASEIPSYLDTTGMGDIEGNSGSPGYSAEVNAIINLCGALGSVSWMHAGDEPVCSMHGTIDGTVPYATAIISVLGFPVMMVDGSHTVDSMATVLSLDHVFHTWQGADHVPYLSNTTYMDSTVEFVRDFLCGQNLKPSTYVAPTAVNPIHEDDFSVRLCSNLTSSSFTLVNATSANIKVTLLDLSGRLLATFQSADHEVLIPTDGLAAGLYLLRMEGKGGAKTEKVVIAPRN